MKTAMLGEVAAGFPSPAAQYEEESLDLNRLLIRKPAATFFMKVTGDSMVGAGIYQGDIIVVDRSVTPDDGDIVVACIEGEFTVKRIRFHNDNVWLESANAAYRPIFLHSLQELRIFGVVTANVHRFR